MKLLRTIAIGLSLAGLIALSPRALFAEQEHSKMDHAKGNHEAFIKLVNDSAAALKTSNPDLATGLSNYAAKEATELGAKKEEKEAKEKEDKGAIIKLFKDSSAALKASHPDLAAGLLQKADKLEKRLEQKKGEKNEKEEAGEKMEPKSERGENTK